MEHVVFWPGQDSHERTARVGSLEEAVQLVEHLRNDEGVVGATVHALTEVPLTFKTYYRVEVPALEPDPEPEGVGATPADELEVPAVVPDPPQLTVVPAFEVPGMRAEADGPPEPVDLTRTTGFFARD